MNNQEKPTTQGRQDEDKQNKNTIQYELVIHYAQTNTNNVNKTNNWR